MNWLGEPTPRRRRDRTGRASLASALEDAPATPGDDTTTSIDDTSTTTDDTKTSDNGSTPDREERGGGGREGCDKAATDDGTTDSGSTDTTDTTEDAPATTESGS
ncbi:MAG: hypothetical protein WKF45_02745 [Ilumatobacteraceae bacterium]